MTTSRTSLCIPKRPRRPRRTGAWPNRFTARFVQEGRLPSRHVVDGGYVDADAIVTSRSKYDVELFGPVPPENSWQAKAAAGFDLSHAPFRLAEPDPYLPRWTTKPLLDAHQESQWTRSHLRQVCCCCLSAVSEPWAVHAGPSSLLDDSPADPLSRLAVGARAAAYRGVQRGLCYSRRHRKYHLASCTGQ
jgi:hypothetical protein